MVALNVRNLSAETHRALRSLAASHGRSMEAEVRAILEEVVRPKPPVKLGSVLAAIGREFGGVELDVARDQAGTEPASFE